MLPEFCIYCNRFGSYVCPRCSRLFYQPAGWLALSEAGKSGAEPADTSQTDLDSCLSGFIYNKALEHAIKTVKYAGFYRVLARLSKMCLVWQRELLELAQGAVIIPVPLAREKLMVRGFNQAEIFAQELLRALREQTSTHIPPQQKCEARGLRGQLDGLSRIGELLELLKRGKATKTQVGRNKLWRRKNLEGAFVVDYAAASRQHTTKALLIDDIYTTGATLEVCASLLKREGFMEVNSFVFASGRETHTIDRSPES